MAPSLTVTVSTSETLSSSGQTVPRNFAGFSQEIGHASVYSANGSFPRASLLTLLSALQPRHATEPAAFTIRLGGNSADSSCFECAATMPCYTEPPSKPGCSGNLTRAYLFVLEGFASAASRLHGVNVSFVLGTNLGGAVDPAVGARLAAAIGDLKLWTPAGPIKALEVGNECDSYFTTHPKSDLSSFAAYEKMFASYLAAYKAAGMGAHRIQGATFAALERPFFDLGLHSYTRQFQADLATLSLHNYPLQHCFFKKVSIDALVARRSSHGVASLYAPFAADAASAGVPLVLGEAGSANCGGAANVSDTFASALWAVDYMSELSKRGIAGVNFHGLGSTAPYSPISYHNVTDPFDPPAVRPLFYGLLAFNEFTANGSSWRDATVDYQGFREWTPASTAHAVTDRNGVTRVAIIAKDGDVQQPVNVTVRIPCMNASVCLRRGCTASLVRLVARSGGLTAKDGLSFADQTYDGSRDGSPAGIRQSEPVALVVNSAGGTWLEARYATDAASLTMLTLSRLCSGFG
uniref:Beta-glucuronidase C-terminal domain-containing protein n=1 Tax=Calcidiscus leptoporus TaxID=127549 RepID=A0A7S0P2X5_9EUKA|mmetsp:Transcript_51825/g.119140  ORF Transcript_51825/g.119140 Transcript_51825/m.119140 type:complete len:522 (+) Transcript_51825:219-1784(+)